MPFIKPFAVERWFAKYEFTTEINVAESCIKPLTFAEVCSIAGVDPASVFGDEPLGYVDGAGSPHVRALVSGAYPHSGPEEVLITQGAIEANFVLHCALVEPGDVVICQFPAYQQLYEVARSRGAEVRFWRLKPENDFVPAIDDLKALATGRVKLIILNNPHNPTGAVLDEGGLREVIKIADSCAAMVHVDEVYHGIFYREPVMSARAIDPRVCVTSGMSKVYGLSGIRLGWVSAPRNVIEACAVVRDYTSICPSCLSESVSSVVLSRRDAFLARSSSLARQNLEIVAGWMARNRDLLSWAPPRGGVVGFPRYVAPWASERLCARLAEDHGVLLIPGACFEMESRFRLGFGYDTEKLRTGLSRLESFLKVL